MRRWLNSLHPALAGFAPAAVCLGALWAAGPSALGVAGAGAASALAGAGAFHQLARLKVGGAVRALDATVVSAAVTGFTQGIEAPLA